MHNFRDGENSDSITITKIASFVPFFHIPASRAPLLLQMMGLEWAYRLSREPGRLWRRYLIESPRIFRIFMQERAKRSR